MEPIIAKEGKRKALPLPPAENTQAVCFDLWDLGLQAGEWKGKPKVTHRVKLGFELDSRIESADDFNGKRHHIYKDYTLSLDKKANLRKDLEAWRGRPFTAEELDGFNLQEALPGANCLANIIHYTGQDGNVRAKISAITSLPKNMPKIAAETDRGTPDWIKNIQAEAVKLEAPPTEGQKDANSVPF